MKTIFNFSLLRLLIILLTVSASCQKDNKSLYVEVALGSQNSIAEVFSQGITFKYFLSNEKGEPQTQFKEGENFYFNFSIKNEKSEDLFIVNDFLTNKSFCAIHADKISNAQPFEFSGREKIGSAAHKLLANDEYFLKVPWSDSRDNWNSLHCEFISNHCSLLPKGIYSSSFSQTFCFDRPNMEDSLCISEITFKINFEVI
jgi:hypothetical protein